MARGRGPGGRHPVLPGLGRDRWAWHLLPGHGDRFARVIASNTGPAGGRGRQRVHASTGWPSASRSTCCRSARSSRRARPGRCPTPRWRPTTPRSPTAPTRPRPSASRCSSRCSPTTPAWPTGQGDLGVPRDLAEAVPDRLRRPDQIAFRPAPTGLQRRIPGAQGQPHRVHRGGRATSSRRTPPTSWWRSSTSSSGRRPSEGPVAGPSGPDGTIDPDPAPGRRPHTGGATMATVATVRGPVDAADLGRPTCTSTSSC